MSDATATLDEALGRFREMLASDGYSLSWSRERARTSSS